MLDFRLILIDRTTYVHMPRMSHLNTQDILHTITNAMRWFWFCGLKQLILRQVKYFGPCLD